MGGLALPARGQRVGHDLEFGLQRRHLRGLVGGAELGVRGGALPHERLTAGELVRRLSSALSKRLKLHDGNEFLVNYMVFILLYSFQLLAYRP